MFPVVNVKLEVFDDIDDDDDDGDDDDKVLDSVIAAWTSAY